MCVVCVCVCVGSMSRRYNLQIEHRHWRILANLPLLLSNLSAKRRDRETFNSTLQSFSLFFVQLIIVRSSFIVPNEMLIYAFLFGLLTIIFSFFHNADFNANIIIC